MSVRPRLLRQPLHAAAVAALALTGFCLLAPAAAQADFGIKSMSAGTFNENGSVDLLAGSHPDEFALGFVMNQNGSGEPEGKIRDLIADLPPGMVGNPFAVPRCSAADFEGVTPHCPGSTQIGVAVAGVLGLEAPIVSPVYNLTPPLGVPASFGFSIANNNSFQEASLRPSDYGARVSDITVPTKIEIQSLTETIWGVPSAPSHDSERFCFIKNGEEEIIGCSSDSASVPFLTLPTSCGAPLEWTVRADSLEEPGVFEEETVKSSDEQGKAAGLIGCQGLPFSPTIEARPETAAADSPTGFHFGLAIPQQNAPEQAEQRATAHLKNTVVTLPADLSINPSSANGRGACSLAQIELHGPAPAACPPDSKLGTISVKSPLADHPLAGSVYLARQGENPFGSLIALYIAVDDPLTGVVIKQPLKVEPDIHTGQLTVTTSEIPQLPFESLDFDFQGGPRAPLTTPPTCGTYTTSVDLTPWSAPAAPDVNRADSFPINGGPSGPCANSEAQLPNAPSFEAATQAPLAGAYSPFALRLNRDNGSQRFAALNTTLPPGLSAKLAGVQECSNAQIAQAETRNGLGQGALEQASPSCPQSSEVGTVQVGAGSGTLLFVGGHAYLAGPYKNAPLSLAIVTPAVTGPFDLGTVVVRAALYINETTAQATVKSDPIPTILAGIPLDVRDIRVNVNRNNFTLNPTSCNEKLVSAEEISTTGQITPLVNRFQVGGCKGLDFSPKLSLSMKGSTKRRGHPAFKAVLTQPSGQANIARTTVTLPPTEFIDQNHISNPCTRAQFNESKCPPSSVLGTARAFSPLLEKPLEGKVYFRSNGGERELPDVVANLNGQVHLVLVGYVDAVHKKGSESSRVRTTFATVPDAPVSKFVLSLKGGKKGLLVNSANICKVPNTATVKMTAQNNRALDRDQEIGTGCRG